MQMKQRAWLSQKHMGMFLPLPSLLDNKAPCLHLSSLQCSLSGLCYDFQCIFGDALFPILHLLHTMPENHLPAEPHLTFHISSNFG